MSPTPPNERTRTALLLAASLLLVAGGATALFASGPVSRAVTSALKAERPVEIRPVTPARSLIDFSLTERSGRTVTAADFAGRYVVVHLLFTGCSAGCSLLGQRMAEVQKLTASMPDVKLLSVTVDPRTDTPAVLTKYADGLAADKERWLFLTGNKADVYRLVETSFIRPEESKGPIIPDSFPDTDHFYLVEPSGLVPISFDGMHRRVAPAIVAEIERRRKEAH